MIESSPGEASERARLGTRGGVGQNSTSAEIVVMQIGLAFSCRHFALDSQRGQANATPRMPV